MGFFLFFLLVVVVFSTNSLVSSSVTCRLSRVCMSSPPSCYRCMRSLIPIHARSDTDTRAQTATDSESRVVIDCVAMQIVAVCSKECIEGI